MAEKIVTINEDDFDKGTGDDVKTRHFWLLTGEPRDAELSDENWRKLLESEILPKQVHSRPCDNAAHARKTKRPSKAAQPGIDRKVLQAFRAAHPEVDMPEVRDRGRVPAEAIAAMLNWQAAQR